MTRRVAGVVRCRVAGCRWKHVSVSAAERDRAWNQHFMTNHHDPAPKVVTSRCGMPGCGWTTTGPLPEVRPLALEHSRTHSKENTR